MKQMLLVSVLSVLVVTFAFGQTVTYQGVTLQPGDVINFHKGFVTTAHLISYGHSAMYLGADDAGENKFLDFKMKNRGHRISSEKEFLTSNAKHHPAFAVFRLKDVQNLSPPVMFDAAKYIDQKRYWLPGHTKNRENCCTSIAFVLSKATGKNFRIRDPNDFLGRAFKRHPQLIGKSINIRAALREVEARTPR